ncbi:RNF4 ligase, partial [Climacteris rufus]|nr:RNF4 ligase [Climacteris rufus]
RKRHGGAVDSTQAQKRSRLLPSSAGGTSQTEPTELEECGRPELIIDLTGESSESEVITLSDDESAVVQDGEQSQQNPCCSRAAENSPELLASGNEEEPRENDGYVTDKMSLQLHIFSRSVPSSPQQGVVIRCPICMDFYSEIVKSGRLLVATLCGHVFCSRCLPVALETAGMCPSCRTELTPELYIPLYL